MASRSDMPPFGAPPGTASSRLPPAARAVLVAARTAMENANSEEEAKAAVERFAEIAAPFMVGRDPFSFMAEVLEFDAKTTEDADCPGADDECHQRTCDKGVCGASFTAANTPLAAQTTNGPSAVRSASMVTAGATAG